MPERLLGWALRNNYNPFIVVLLHYVSFPISTRSVGLSCRLPLLPSIKYESSLAGALAHFCISLLGHTMENDVIYAGFRRSHFFTFLLFKYFTHETEEAQVIWSPCRYTQLLYLGRVEEFSGPHCMLLMMT